MAITLKTTALRPPKAPNLPIAPVDYDQRYIDQLNNVLRLYFAQIDNLADGYAAGTFGTIIKFPQGSFYDTSNQYDGSTTIPYAVRLGETSTSYGVSVTSRQASVVGSIATTTMTVTSVNSGRLFPAMLMSGTGVTAGTYVYLQLSSTHPAISGTQSWVSGGTSGTATFVVSGGAGNIEARQFVSGTGVPANTRVVSAVYDSGSGNTTVVLSANFTTNASGNYAFRPWGYEGTYSVSPSQTVSSTTITGDLPSMITFDYPGIYNIQYSLQFTNTNLSTIHDVDVWFRKNDVDLPNSNSVFSVPGKHTGANGQLIAVVNYFAEVTAGDVIEIIWHTNDSTVYIETIPATTSPIRPAAPSAIVTAQFVSAIP